METITYKISYLTFATPSERQKKGGKGKMWQDIVLQAVVLLTAIFMFSFLHNIPQSLLAKLRSSRANSNPNVLAKRHFILGAQLLSKARSSSSSSSSSSSLARSALSEADLSISLNPRDAASHILKSLALDLLGGRDNSTAALESLDTALSPPAVKSLGEEERADALVKRAEIRMRLAGTTNNQGRRRRKGKEDGKEDCVADLEAAVRIKGNSAKAWRLLGEWYEGKGMMDQARDAYESAARAGDSTAAEAAQRLD